MVAEKGLLIERDSLIGQIAYLFAEADEHNWYQTSGREDKQNEIIEAEEIRWTHLALHDRMFVKGHR